MITLQNQESTIRLKSPRLPIEVIQLPVTYTRLMNGKLQARKGRKCNLYEKHFIQILNEDAYIQLRLFLRQATGRVIKLTRYDGTNSLVRLMDDPTKIQFPDQYRRTCELRFWIDTDAGAPV